MPIPNPKISPYENWTIYTIDIIIFYCRSSTKLLLSRKQNNQAYEWLYFKNDSVMILGMKNKTCKENLGLDKWFSNLRSKKHSLFPVIIKNNEWLFTKQLTTSYAGNDIVLKYFYRCVLTPKGLQVHLDYENLSMDMFGPPDRLYKPYKRLQPKPTGANK